MIENSRIEEKDNSKNLSENRNPYEYLNKNQFGNQNEENDNILSQLKVQNQSFNEQDEQNIEYLLKRTEFLQNKVFSADSMLLFIFIFKENYY